MVVVPRHMNGKDRRSLGSIRWHIRYAMRREIPTLLITAPIVVPIWWVLWKVCDSLWSMSGT